MVNLIDKLELSARVFAAEQQIAQLNEIITALSPTLTPLVNQLETMFKAENDPQTRLLIEQKFNLLYRVREQFDAGEIRS